MALINDTKRVAQMRRNNPFALIILNSAKCFLDLSSRDGKQQRIQRRQLDFQIISDYAPLLRFLDSIQSGVNASTRSERRQDMALNHVIRLTRTRETFVENKHKSPLEKSRE